MQKLG
jgi:Hsp70 protein